MVELCAKNLQIMRNDFKDYARRPIMRTFHEVSKKNKPATGNIR